MNGEVVVSSSTISYIVAVSKHHTHTPIRCYNLSRNSCTNSKFRLSLRCSSSSSSSGPSPPELNFVRYANTLITGEQVLSFTGENQNKTVLDAFFLGKALAEELIERIESTAGEFLSTIGRLQAEQQKQVQEFQDEVQERARKSKEKAAREVMEVHGTPSSSNAREVTDLQPHDITQTPQEPPS
ncbi:uncharacterized protein LOC141684281 isoform X2 [Apium graveolens]|uniref:uncharacterized protein LOC141684281 isoform X2 n=1 Tax=Apium graveolens TaxID=4045 RepID=UPI003D7BC2C9